MFITQLRFSWERTYTKKKQRDKEMSNIVITTLDQLTFYITIWVYQYFISLGYNVYCMYIVCP